MIKFPPGRNFRLLAVGAAHVCLLVPLGNAGAVEPAVRLPAAVVGAQKVLTPSLVVTYKTPPAGDPIKLHVFLPPIPGENRPAVVFFFGGGWAAGSPESFYQQCAALAQRGLVAISAQYRTLGSHGTTVAECVADARSAVRWTRRNARVLGIDPLRVGAGGGSAGGHLALTTALEAAFDDPADDLTVSCRPDLLVLYNPVIDNSPTGIGNDFAIERTIHKRVKDYWERLSPIHNIRPGAPPSIMLLGTKDQHVPVATAEAFAARMREVGTECELRLYQDQPHAFYGNRNGDNPYFGKTLEAVMAFLERHGWLQPETH